MKKFLFASLLCLGMSTGLYAESLEDTQFKQYVELSKNHPNNPPGMTMCADYKYRIVYVSMPISLPASNINQQMKTEIKKQMLQAMRSNPADAKVIKDLKINAVYTFLTTDKNIFCVTISHRDF